MKKYIICLTSLIIISCSNQSTPSGVVAVVNGSYITLNELRNRYDVQTMHINEFAPPPVDSFHKEYTETLLEMIVELAVEQELAKHKIVVSDDIVNKAVRDIQGGYSEEEFSQMLAERYIDFDSWKKQVRAGVVENLYLKQVLVNNASATSDEIKRFYEKNPALFVVDYRIYGLLLSSKDKAVIEQAVTKLEHGATKEDIMKQFPSVHLEDITADSSNIPMEHIDEVTKVSDKKATTLQNTDDMYSTVFVKHRTKQVKLSLEEAWKIAQEYVIEQKVRGLYDTAVDEILKHSSIQVVEEFKSAIDGMLKHTVVSEYHDAENDISPTRTNAQVNPEL